MFTDVGYFWQKFPVNSFKMLQIQNCSTVSNDAFFLFQKKLPTRLHFRWVHLGESAGSARRLRTRLCDDFLGILDYFRAMYFQVK